MSDIHLPSNPEPDGGEDQPEVRLELTRAGVEQVLSLYSQEQGAGFRDKAFGLRLEDFEQAIRERRRMLVVGLALGVALGLGVLLVSTPLYPVSAQVVLERHEISSDATSVSPGSAGSAFVATQAQVLESPSIIADAVASIPRASHLDEDDDAVLDAVEAIVATPVSSTQVVALGYLGPDPAHGVQLLNAIVESYRSSLRREERQSQSQKLAAKQTEIDVLESEARAVEERVEKLRVEYGILGSVEDAAATQAAIVRDQTDRLTATRSERMALEKRLATGGEQLAILDPATRNLQEQLWEAEAELARVRLTLTAEHPAVEQAQHQVNVLRSQLRRSSRATPDALRRDIEAAKGLEAELLEAYTAERERLAAIESHRREETLLLTELDRIRAMIDVRRAELLDQRLVTRLAESGESGITARIIEAPAPPLSAAWPRPKFVLAIGAVVGLAGGFVAALLSLRREARWTPAPRPLTSRPERR